METRKRLIVFADARRCCRVYAQEGSDEQYEPVAVQGEYTIPWQPTLLQTLLTNLQWPLSSTAVQILIRSTRPLELALELDLPRTQEWTLKQILEVLQNKAFTPAQPAGSWIVNNREIGRTQHVFPVSVEAKDPAYLYTWPIWCAPEPSQNGRPDLQDIMLEIAKEKAADKDTQNAPGHGTLDPDAFRIIAEERRMRR